MRVVVRVLIVLLGLQILFLGLLIATTDDAPSRAILAMGLCLIFVWVIVGGTLMFRLREKIRRTVQSIRMDWRVMFVLFATLLALIEEAVTTSLTNLAPLFGVEVGAAYITASPHYLEVVAFHSVVVFIPMFIGWAWLLNRYRFTPGQVFLLFGLTGLLAEMVSFGANLVALPMWVFIYGLMLYLPAYCVPQDRPAHPVRVVHYPLAVIFPLLCAIPVALMVSQFHPTPNQFITLNSILFLAPLMR